MAHHFMNGQYVQIEQTPASIGHRIFAQLIDTVLMYFYALASTAAMAVMGRVNSTASMIVAVVLTLISILYAPICEQIWGRTLGKYVLKMRVVMQNGEAVSIGASILRWLLWYFDLLGFGLLSMFCNHRNMRIGDLAAGTIVVMDGSEKAAHAFDESMNRFTNLNPDYQPKYPFAAQLRWGQISFINQTMLRHDRDYCSQQQRRNIEMLAQMLAQKYGVEGILPHNSNKFLRTIVADYNYYTWEDEK